jgi:hypothetical protein
MLNSAPEHAAVKPIFGKFGARKSGVVRLTPLRDRAGKNRTLETEGCGTRTAPVGGGDPQLFLQEYDSKPVADVLVQEYDSK